MITRTHIHTRMAMIFHPSTSMNVHRPLAHIRTTMLIVG